MVAMRYNPRGSGTSDEKIRRLIHEEVAAAIQAEISEMFGSIKTMLIETFDERYAAAATTAAFTAARP